MNADLRAKASKKVTLVGAVVDLCLALLKIIIGFIGNSNALIADGVHSFSDLLSDGVVLYAAKRGNEAPDAEHPYGHERFETIATLGLAIILTLVGVGIIANALDRLTTPEPISHNMLLLLVAGLSILSKEALYWYTITVANTYQSAMLKANAWHHRSDSLSSIVVLIGIIGASQGYLYLDGMAAIVIGLMIIYIAWGLGLNATKELVDTSISAKKVAQLSRAIGKISGVNNVHSLRTRKIGHLISCDVHVQVDPFLSVSEGHIISVSVERVAKNCLENLNDVTVHIDPEDDETHAPYDSLPERAQALDILNKALLNNQCAGDIQHIQLHYLEGKIHVDFFLPPHCLSADSSYDDILKKLTQTVDALPNFGKTRLYFGE